MPPKLGTLQIYVAEGRNLPNRDFFGKQDPFLEFNLGGIAKRTRVDKKGGANPKWKEDVYFDVPAGVSSLAMRCADRDISSSDDIGAATIDLARIYEEEEVHAWYKMQRKNKFAGEIFLEFTFTPISGRKKPSLHKIHKPMASMATLNNVAYEAQSSTGATVVNPVAAPTNGPPPFAQSHASLSSVGSAGRPPAAPHHTPPATNPVQTPYPPHSGAMYPPAGGAAYPPANGTSYPPANRPMYPPSNFSMASFASTDNFTQSSLNINQSTMSLAPGAYPPSPAAYGSPAPYPYTSSPYGMPPAPSSQPSYSGYGASPPQPSFAGGFVAPTPPALYPPGSSPSTSLPPAGMVNVYPPGLNPHSFPEPSAPPLGPPGGGSYPPGGFTFSPY
ncbi:hypothetical protein IWQ60_005081 [Tieghemiomyces parasiticus]|uniref:C2 domain-containing protein n=1 Tax=Tieghemiomyces parasiticus TaxID=78921 RepID=A0A9W8A7N5_9FUNG|nr:hypothetical protein IWQ60_005081 [Tieghemiomyces parasiticus]